MPDLPDPAQSAAAQATGPLHAEAGDALDPLALVACRALGGAFALVTRLDGDRQTVAGRAGAAFDEGAVVDGPCRQTVALGVPLVVSDTSADEVTRDGPAVRAGAAAYVGVPLVAGGGVVGALAVCDVRPHGWTDQDVSMLTGLAGAVSAVVAARAAGHERGARGDHDGDARTAADLQLALDAGGMGRWETTADGDMLQDARTRSIHELPPGEAGGVLEATSTIHPGDRGRLAEAYRAALAGGAGTRLDHEYRVVHPDGSVRWARIAGQNRPGEAGLNGVVWDVTSEKETQAALVRTALRKALLLDLAQRWRQADEPAQILEAAAAELGRHLGAHRVGFFETRDGGRTLDFDAGPSWSDGPLGPLSGTLPADALGPAYVSQILEGRTLATADMDADPLTAGSAFSDLGVRAGVGAPVLRNGAWVAGLYVNHAETRAWTDAEVALVHEVADQAWDAVERVRAVVEVRQSEERYRTLFNSVTVGFCVIDLVRDERGRAVDYRYVETNPAFAAQTGLRDPDGQLASDLAPDLDRQWVGAYAEIAETGVARRFERRAPDTGREFDVYATRVGGPGSGRVAVLFTDVSERRAAEEAVRASEAQFRATFENAAVGIAHVGLDGTWLRVNQRLSEIVGYSRDELLTRTFQGITHPDDLGSDVGLFQRLLAGDLDHYQLEKRYLHRDGHVVWINLTVALATGADGQPMHAISVVEDVSEKKAAEAELVALNAVLEERVADRTAELARSNDELDRFAYVASHDLKAPIRAIDSLAAWIAEDAGDVLPPGSAEHLRLLRGRAERMEGLLDGLLAYSRAGRGEAAPEPVDLAALVARAVETVTPPQGFDVSVEVPAPPVVTERVPLALVVRNLIGNAIKHHDRPDGRVTVAARVGAGGLTLEIGDDGPGIAPDYQERVFEMFQTLRPRDEVEASGMGLAIVRKTVEARGGTVAVRSEGRGTTFEVTWPLPPVP